MKRWLLACLTMLCMVALLVGCGSDTAKQGKQGKHMKCLVCIWFGETLDPTHEWDAWTLTRIGAGETLANGNTRYEICSTISRLLGKCGPYNMEIPHP